MEQQTMKQPIPVRDVAFTPAALAPLAFEVEGAEPITTDKAYRHTLRTVEELERSLTEYRVRGGHDLEPGMRQLVMDSMQALIEEWGEQAREYEALKSGNVPLTLRSLRELPLVLVRARVAAGLSQKQLAQRLGLKAQQIQRYEATRYRTITLGRMLEVAEALGLRLEGSVALER